MKNMIKKYSELIKLETFDERFNYLKLSGSVGIETFGFDRYMNQIFYRSQDWLNIRDEIIIRDNGNDLGVNDYIIFGKIIVHHMNPFVITDLVNNLDELLNPEYLISTQLSTHNAIHYGSESPPNSRIIERTKNDTSPWRL